MERSSFDIRREKLDLMDARLDTQQSASAIETSSTTGDDAGDVKDWIAQVKQLQLQRKAEDEARNRQLEADILAERQARQARRAQRSRSVSPEKSVDTAVMPKKASVSSSSTVLEKAETSTATEKRTDEPKKDVRSLLENRDPSFFRQSPKPIGLRKSSQGSAASSQTAIPGMSRSAAPLDKSSLENKQPLSRNTVDESVSKTESRDKTLEKPSPPKPVSAGSPVIAIKPTLTKLPDQPAPLTSPTGKRNSTQLVSPATPVSSVQTPTQVTRTPTSSNKYGPPSRSGSPTRAESPTRFAHMQQAGHSPMSSTDLLATMRSGLRSTATQRQQTPDHVKATLLQAKGGLRSPTSPAAKTFGGVVGESRTPNKLSDSPRLFPPRQAFSKNEDAISPVARQNSAPVAVPLEEEKPASFVRHQSMPPREAKQSTLASRFNPALAGLLQRGPPVPKSKPAATAQADTQADLSPSGSMPIEQEKAALSEGGTHKLTHMTKTRARRPGKRPSTTVQGEASAPSQKTDAKDSSDDRTAQLSPADRPVTMAMSKPLPFKADPKPSLRPSALPELKAQSVSTAQDNPALSRKEPLPVLSAKPSLAERFHNSNVESLLVAPKPMGSPHRFDTKRPENRSPTLPGSSASPVLPDLKRLSISSAPTPTASPLMQRKSNGADSGPSSSMSGAIPGMWSQARRKSTVPVEKTVEAPTVPSKAVQSVQLEDVVPPHVPQTKMPTPVGLAPNPAAVKQPAASTSPEAPKSPSVYSGRSVSPFKREGRMQSIHHHQPMRSSTSMTDVADLLKARANSILNRDLSIKAAPQLPSPQTSPRLPWAETARPPPTSAAPSVTRLNSRPAVDGCALLFCVRQHVRSIVIDELVCAAANLCSGFVYLVQEPEQVTIWQGRGAAPAEVEAAREFAHALSDATPAVVREGSETAPFWRALGGQQRYASASYWKLKKDFKHYRTALYTVDRVDDKIHISVKESFSVGDLAPDKVHVLDTFFELYTMIPSLQANAKRDEILAALRFVKDHSGKSGHTRPFVPMALVVGCLSRWPRDLKAVFREQVEDQQPTLAILELEAAEQVLRFSKFSRKELAEGTALGADYRRLEAFCEEGCFAGLFGMDRQQFLRASFEEQTQSRTRAHKELGLPPML